MRCVDEGVMRSLVWCVVLVLMGEVETGANSRTEAATHHRRGVSTGGEENTRGEHKHKKKQQRNVSLRGEEEGNNKNKKITAAGARSTLAIFFIQTRSSRASPF
jgi:hypothetical protein